MIVSSASVVRVGLVSLVITTLVFGITLAAFVSELLLSRGVGLVDRMSPILAFAFAGQRLGGVAR
jgi:hypothetical protein